MPQLQRPPARSVLPSLILIALIVGGAAAGFATLPDGSRPGASRRRKCWPRWRRPEGLLSAIAAITQKGICFTGVFEANGNGTSLSHAQVFERGQHPALGRFNLGTPDPNAPDATVRVRGMGLRITPPDSQEWRMAMIDAPVFAASTPRAFRDLLLAAGTRTRTQ